MTPRIELRIEELGVSGLDAADARRLARSIEQALGEMLATPPVLDAATVGRLDAGTVRGASPEALGRSVAAALLGSLGR